MLTSGDKEHMDRTNEHAPRHRVIPSIHAIGVEAR
jgi:hypothetical protein